MTAPARALVGLNDSADRDAVEAVLPVDSSLELVDVVEGLDSCREALARQDVDVLLVACSNESDQTLSFIEEVTHEEPNRPVIVLHPGSPNGFISRAFGAGADDVVALPEDNSGALSPVVLEQTSGEVLLALEKALARRERINRPVQQAGGRMVTILGPKGGSGKTLVTCNLAATLAEAGKRVVVVDLDLQFGDVGLALGIPPAQTIADLAASGGSLDAEKLSAYLHLHESGARVLLAPARPDQAGAITTEFLEQLYRVLRSTEDWLVVDTPPGFTPEVITSIDASSDVCMVGVLDALSLKNTKLGLDTLDRMGFEPERVKLVLNRADSRVGITPADAQTVTGRRPDVLLPSDREIPRAVNQALPIVRSQPRSQPGRALRSLGEAYLDGQHGSRRRRLFGGLR